MEIVHVVSLRPSFPVSKPVLAHLACVTGIRRGGKGERRVKTFCQLFAVFEYLFVNFCLSVGGICEIFYGLSRRLWRIEKFVSVR